MSLVPMDIVRVGGDLKPVFWLLTADLRSNLEAGSWSETTTDR